MVNVLNTMGLSLKHLEILFNIELQKILNCINRGNIPKDATPDLLLDWMMSKEEEYANLSGNLKAKINWYDLDTLIEKINENDPTQMWFRLVLLEATIYKSFDCEDFMRTDMFLVRFNEDNFYLPGSRLVMRVRHTYRNVVFSHTRKKSDNNTSEDYLRSPGLMGFFSRLRLLDEIISIKTNEDENYLYPLLQGAEDELTILAGGSAILLPENAYKVATMTEKGGYRPLIARLEVTLKEIILYYDSDVEFACHIVDMYRVVLNDLKALAVTDQDINPNVIKFMSESLDRIISNNEEFARKRYAE